MEHCENCKASILDEKDLDLNARVSYLLKEENTLKTAYNGFREDHGFEPLNFEEMKEKKKRIRIMLCLKCLLTAFRPKEVDKDDVSPFEGGILHGLGVNEHAGPVFGDEELKITTKRKFDHTQHCLSKGFKELAIPASIKEGLIPAEALN